MNELKNYDIRVTVEIYVPYDTANCKIKFNVNEIIDLNFSPLIKNEVIADLPEISQYDTYKNNPLLIPVVNAFLGGFSLLMFFLIPFQIMVSLFDLI